MNAILEKSINRTLKYTSTLLYCMMFFLCGCADKINNANSNELKFKYKTENAIEMIFVKEIKTEEIYKHIEIWDMKWANDHLYVLDKKSGNVLILDDQFKYRKKIFQDSTFKEEYVMDMDVDNNGNVLVLDMAYIYIYDGEQKTKSNIYHINTAILDNNTFWAMNGVGYPEQKGETLGHFDLRGLLLQSYPFSFKDEVVRDHFCGIVEMAICDNKLVCMEVLCPVMHIWELNSMAQRDVIINDSILVDYWSKFREKTIKKPDWETYLFNIASMDVLNDKMYISFYNLGKVYILKINIEGNVEERYVINIGLQKRLLKCSIILEKDYISKAIFLIYDDVSGEVLFQVYKGSKQ